VCDEGEFEDVSLTDDMHFEERDVGATSPLQMQQNLHVWYNIPNQQECVDLKDDLCFPFFYRGDRNGPSDRNVCLKQGRGYPSPCHPVPATPSQSPFHL
jgi:hypothetical protein